jgi:hypothetical protein
MCGAPADKADHKYVLRGWTDAGRGWMPSEADPQSRSAGQALNLPAPPAAGPLSLNVYKVFRRHPRESGAVQ